MNLHAACGFALASRAADFRRFKLTRNRKRCLFPLMIMKHFSWLLLLPLFALTLSAPAQNKKTKQEAPKVVVVVPLAVTPGVKTKLAIRGLKLDEAVEIRCSAPEASVRILKTAKTPVGNNQDPNRLGDTLVEAEITLPKETPAGEVLLQVLTPTAEVPPHRLLVNGDPPPITEKEPNNGFRQAQPIAVPQLLDGMINQPQDVDVFKIEGQQGQKLVFEVLAARLGSPVDASLTLHDASGQIIASADDSADSVDPRLEVTLPRTGTYYLSLIDVHDQGGAQYVYRLIVDVKK